MTLSERLRALRGRREIRVGTWVVALVAVGAWWWWPLTRAHSAIDVVVVGDGAVQEANDELARRLRQEGMVPSIVIIDAGECGAVDGLINRGTDALVVLSLDDWSSCTDVTGIDLLVQQPDGPLPVGIDSTLGIREAAPLFGSDAQPCQWWDTPGAGEDRPGLGQCEADGRVVVVENDGLTPAGRERFARLVAEALK
jgi:hypothetical protein